MTDLLSSVRLQNLLDQADSAVRLRDDTRRRDGDTAEIDEALNSIYRDLGRALYLLVRTGADDGPMLPDPREDETTAFTVEIDRDREEGGSWYTDEVELSHEGPLFEPGDLAPDEHTDIPESDDPGPERPEPPVEEIDDWHVLTLDQLKARANDPNDALGELADPTIDAPSWAHKLDELLKLIELPPDLTDPQELSVEASRVQWAASELEVRLVHLPDSVQLALIGLIGTRAQHLRRHLEVDVGPKLALDRLRRYRLDNELPALVALTAEPSPETGSWADDAAAFWSLLQVRAKTSR